MNDAHLGLTAKSPKAVGWLRWKSCGKTFSVGRARFTIKAAGVDDRVVGILELVYIGGSYCFPVKLILLSRALGWESHSMVWY